MRKMIAVTAAMGILLAATPASAAVKKVNAAVNAVAWDAVDVDDGEHYVLCSVFVNDFGDDPHVSLACFGDEGYGRAWVRVKVPDVKGKVTRVRAETTGDCTGREIAWNKKRSTVLVTISVTAESDCEVRTVRVRYS